MTHPGGGRRVRRAALLLAGAALAACAPAAAGGGGGGGGGGPVAGGAVEVSPGGCGRGWDRPRGGTQVFELRNTSGGAADVQLMDASGALLGEVEGLGPGTVRELRVTLGRGEYAFRCLPEGSGAVTGPTVRVTDGPVRGGPAVPPVTRHDLIPPALAYQRWVARGLDRLVGRVEALRTAVARRNLPAARTAWLAAHLGYARLGGAYGAFGELGEAVDGVVRPVSGFHRVERGLWHGESAAALRTPVERLVRDVRALRTQWARTRLDPAELPVRAHEITEDALQADLTGRSDHGSGTPLATARAGLDGTAELLRLLRPLLVRGDARLPRSADALLRRAVRDLAVAARPGGGWQPPAALARPDRERIDADFGALAELLARVATRCDPRRTA
ncbi:imelysin family protein [Streptomyces sp. NPDC092296]|uniref:imelysin family protein n=1 Tax=Streptomyces sp. NPDC092296 TaxID=3366012 RepID=UPI003816B451